MHVCVHKGGIQEFLNLGIIDILKHDSWLRGREICPNSYKICSNIPHLCPLDAQKYLSQIVTTRYVTVSKH